ncbi:MAG: tRNA lysidine(34) synthetase TilS [Pseudomonadales bacterium]|nr:tRNA lysidine(34) synthetase TilS [Pseudomonadales bacterium]
MTPAVLDSLLAEFPAARRWVVGYSGGLDSSVLLHLCVRFLADRDDAPRLLALHVNHAVHAYAADWEQHCARVCAALGVVFVARRAQLPCDGSGHVSEDVLRVARYREFESFCSESDLLLLAHHRDDQSETVLLRLLRGAGPAGLAGMPRARMLGRAMLCRPLLAVPRTGLYGYALEHGVYWVDDPSNELADYDRNYLRTTVFPLLEGRWPGAGQRMTRAASHCAEAAQICAGRAEEDLGTVCRIDAFGQPCFSLEVWRAMPLPRALNVLRAWLEQHAIAVDSRLLDTVVNEVIGAAPDRQPLIAVSSAQLRRFADCLYVVWRSPRRFSPEPLAGIAPDFDDWLPGVGRVNLQHSVGGVRAGRNYAIRFRQPGMQCRVAGRPRKRLKKLLQELSVPPWWRDRIPLLFVDGELAAVADLCICEGFVADPGSAAVMLRWTPGEPRPQ